MGRPQIYDNLARLSISLDKAEKDILEKQAQQKNMKLSEYIRGRLFRSRKFFYWRV